ncbi:MAG: Hpt domain-containing protein [Xanthobacteraceae bacterium]
MTDAFTERLANVRHRFVTSLEDKIKDTYAAIPNLAASCPTAADTVLETYRRVHNIVGIGATIGFASTGRAAHSVENILLPPQRASRGLTEKEIREFETALADLHKTATRELQIYHSAA